MKKMRVMSMVMAGMMAVSLLTACGGKNTAESSVAETSAAKTEAAKTTENEQTEASADKPFACLLYTSRCV